MRRGAAFLALPLLLGGCAALQSVGRPEGRDALLTFRLLTLFGFVTGFFFLVTMAFLVAAYWRRRGSRQDGLDDPLTVPTRSPMLKTALFVWTGIVVATLMGLALASYFTDRGLAHPNRAGHPVLSVVVTGNQWWWDVTYHFPDTSQNFRTANELHIPAGVPTMITLKSNDVIHSFWVPNLAGKQDLIPGRLTDIVLVPTKPGVYRGQCAEFCGLQHAHMALDVSVDGAADFRAWMAAQLKTAPPPATPEAKAGYDYFMSHPCSSCHAVAGTPASATVAPDLTHVASRKTIGAGTLPNGTGPLHAWVADPQGVKPGNNMPYIGLDADDLHHVVAYLETLK
ncbi:MAG: c-type cytochrome [Allosphingosinicella sp.]